MSKKDNTWLASYGLMIQKARPLHEGTIYTLEVYPGSGNLGTGESIERFWRAGDYDPCEEGRGGRSRVMATARQIIKDWGQRNCLR